MAKHVRITKDMYAIMSDDEIIATYDTREDAQEGRDEFYRERWYKIRQLTISWEEER